MVSSGAKRRKMNSTSPASSSISTTAIVGGGGGGGGGGSSSNNTATDEFHFPSDLISIQDRKDEAMRALKSDLMTALDKKVKSLDEDKWMFEGPRSRIHLISRAGGFLNKQIETTKNRNLTPPR